MNNIDNQEIKYQIFKLIIQDSNLTQRQMAKEIGLSLGKFNYCLKELTRKGFVKINRFLSSDNKAAYRYLLTPQGIEEKTKLTLCFLKRKMEEFEATKKQIKELSQEVEEGNFEKIIDFDKYYDHYCPNV